MIFGIRGNFKTLLARGSVIKERGLPSIAAPSVLPRDAAKFHELRDADEKPLVVPLRTQGEI